MPPIIKSIRILKNMGILQDKTTKIGNIELNRFNLIYGFNGCGKSTLSRLFASLEIEARHPKLPDDSEFEIELSDTKVLTCPANLLGLRRRVTVFNSDFIEQNFHWSTAKANPIFYIGRTQAEAAAELEKSQASLPALQDRVNEASNLVRATGNALAAFKRNRARMSAGMQRLRGRKYEAGELASDYNKLSFHSDDVLSAERLESVAATCRLDEPMPKVMPIAVPESNLGLLIPKAQVLLSKTPANVVLAELERHPEMLHWIKQAKDYHTSRQLDQCLFCGSRIASARMEHLARALDNELERFLSDLDAVNRDMQAWMVALARIREVAPADTAIMGELRYEYRANYSRLISDCQAVENILAKATALLAGKRQTPTLGVDISNLPDAQESNEKASMLAESTRSMNETILKHNSYVDEFDRHQASARLAVRKHFLSEGLDEYRSLTQEGQDAQAKATLATNECQKARERIQALRAQIREHGPAAEVITSLVKSYLGHGELSIKAVDEGYELHRHSRLIDGAPSEGEKTAIALCYFMSTLRSEGRSLKDLIVVVDDPISSLDTKALHFACSMLLGNLSNVAQVIIMTHNQNCMNEIRKKWKNKWKRLDESKPVTANLFFLDTLIPKGNGKRVSRIVTMSRLLREYDSEYHFLADHFLRFAGSSDDDYEYAYMMPNVMRRLLEIFLAFRFPGSGSVIGKLEEACKEHDKLDKYRLFALERLVQLESHSDNHDDAVSFSAMTIEQSRDACAALMEFMEIADRPHLDGLRKLCAKP